MTGAPPIDADRFTAEVAQALAALPGLTVAPLRTLALKVDLDGRPGTLDLERAFQVLRRDPSQKDAMIARLVGGLPEARQAGSVDPDRVMPLLRSLEDLVRLLQGRSAAGRTPARPFVDSLVLTLVHDGQNSLRVLSRADLDRLARTDDQLWALAQANLARLPFTRAGEGPIQQVLAGGSFDATLLWHPGLLASLDPAAGVRAAIPCRGVLLLCEQPDRAALAELRALSAEVAASRPHPLQVAPLVYGATGWRTDTAG